jgi:hypothetical protein
MSIEDKIEDEPTELDLVYEDLKKAEARIIQLENELSARIAEHGWLKDRIAQLEDLNERLDRAAGRQLTH